jgi:prefoldin alpha subunit
MAEKKQEKATEAGSEMQQEKLIRMSILEQDAKQIEQQMQMVEQQVMELQILSLNLDELEKAKEKDEMLSSIGKNIFVKTSLLSKDLLVNVGAKTVVKKTVAETKEVVSKDLNNLISARNNLARELERVIKELETS